MVTTDRETAKESPQNVATPDGRSISGFHQFQIDAIRNIIDDATEDMRFVIYFLIRVVAFLLRLRTRRKVGGCRLVKHVANHASYSSYHVVSNPKVLN